MSLLSPPKKFVLKHRFPLVPGMVNREKRYGPSEVHFGIPWRIKIQRSGSHFAAFLCCQKTTENFQVVFEMKIFSVLGIERSRKTSFKILDLKTGNDGYGWDFMKWDDVENHFLIRNSVSMECHVELKEVVRPSYRRFDESAKEMSDVVLVVEEQRFHVSKLFLSFQSPYFHSLLLGNFIESSSSEIILKDVNPESFQFFLELLHGESSITEDNIESLLHLGDMFDCPTVMRRCEEYLFLFPGKIELKEKLRLAVQYRMKDVKRQCLQEVKTIADIPDILPIPLRELNLRTAISMLKTL
ncbi:CBN-BATH-25 protein [Caenorhabditis brenneri]|uniref:CBN-BATH-25 protein n=1 Tax=Caenorhabditis brenneri TaxID=135651 RepID=G0MJS5_CAEBE|nr:CBN-BATH-25 protein [Caenorhabditis brenneri]